MKAFSPVRSVRKNSLSDHSLGISRSKTPVDDPMSLLYNMNDCYSKLKELVPSIPQNKKVSKMEILQHVIDYILDLQIALDSHPTIVSLHHQRPGQSQASRTPLTTLNTDISILSLQRIFTLAFLRGIWFQFADFQLWKSLPTSPLPETPASAQRDPGERLPHQ
ncbi:DNA-binding protein inhibitor ID-2-like protein [Camelus ferus]|nr:DNA-binding protein inhibitor ID-2-like protein [Camelus ferus]